MIKTLDISIDRSERSIIRTLGIIERRGFEVLRNELRSGKCPHCDTEIAGKWYEFGYYEYTGDDFDGDMAKLDAEPRNTEWLQICDPMQIPLEGETGWREMERAYFNP